MSWFKVDDKLHDHRKARTAGVAAMGFWLLAGSWSADNLTDGFVPCVVAQRWDPQWRRLAAKLVAVGLWDVAELEGEAGWLFRSWAEYQPTADEVRGKRDAARDRMRRNRSTPRSADVRANSEGSSRPVPDARPGPSRPDLLQQQQGADGPLLPPPVEILRGRLEAARLLVRWDTLTADELEQIVALIVLHGDGPLVDSARRSFRADSPPAFAKAWLAQWSNLTAPGRLRAVEAARCDLHQLPEPCRGCAADQKAGEA